MRILLRLVATCVLGVAVIAGALVALPVAWRNLWHHTATSVAAYLPPLTSDPEDGSTVYADNGTVLAHLSASVTRDPVPFSAIPRILVKAVLDTEDERFYQHGGIDVPSALRALLDDSSGAGLQGGSTITQQLVKQVYLTSQRTLSRKIREAVIADRLEKRYTKNQILDAYLNTVYLGSGAYGVAAAVKAYWGEPLSKVTIPQAALIAGLIQNPSNYDPVSNPTAARVRRSEVIGRMLHYGTITARQARAANNAPLPTSVTIEPTQLGGVDGYYVRWVEDQLLGAGSPLGSTPSERYTALFEGGLKIYTNLDPTLQADAEQAVVQDTPANSEGYQEALVSIQPSTGAVRALIAGQNYAQEQFDVVTQGLRQPGSGFKLFTLLASLQAGDNIFDPVDGTSPCAIPFPGNDSLLANPAHNDEGDGRSGVTTIEEATAQSLNCAYLRMAHQVGLPAVVAQAERMGIPASELSAYASDPSMVIGAAGVSPLQMSAAYAALADDGVYHPPSFIAKVLDRTGNVIYQQPSTGRRIASQEAVEEADAAFQAVVQYGTGTAAAIPGREVAGKTGTNSGPTDAWFNGFTPQLESTVWFGYLPSDLRQLIVDGAQVYGGTYPAETVHSFLSAALAGQPVEDFPAIDYAALPPTRGVPEVTGPTPGVTGSPYPGSGGQYPGTPYSGTPYSGTSYSGTPYSGTGSTYPSTTTPASVSGTTGTATTTPQTVPTGPPTTVATSPGTTAAGGPGTTPTTGPSG